MPVVDILLYTATWRGGTEGRRAYGNRSHQWEHHSVIRQPIRPCTVTKCDLFKLAQNVQQYWYSGMKNDELW